MHKKYLLIPIVVAVAWWTFSFNTGVLAAVQDSDLDSLTDESETTIYGTDPVLFDTDGDGVGDGEEIIDSTNPLDPGSSHLIELKTKSDPGILGEREKRAWFFGRASGIAAFVLFSLVVIHGLIMTSRVWGRIFSMPTINAIHEYLSIAALAIATAHMVSFFFDDYLHINFSEALVPFLLERSFLSAQGFDIGIAVSLGILAIYLAIILVFTSLYRSKLPLKFWRFLHYFGFAFYFLMLFHGFMAGTDSVNPGIKFLYGTSLLIVSSLILLRIIVARRMRQRIQAAQRDQSQSLS